jgi:bacterioferritin-associated ferredoxin
MYICSCNSLTDTQVKYVVQEGACRPRDVYAACGCYAQCGGCTKMILGVIRDHLPDAPCVPTNQ